MVRARPHPAPTVPDDLARAVLSWAGEPGAAWIASLPALVTSLAEEWSLDVGAAFQPCGYGSWTAPAVRADGTPCVLKVRVPDEDSSYEGAALRHYGGGAAVALLAEDVARDALLLERCDPGTPLLREPDDVVATVVAETLGELWSPPAPDHGLRRLRDLAPSWAATMAACDAIDARLREEAIDLLRDLPDDRPEVVLHGDLHAANVLRAARRGWLAIDPKGLVGEATFDVAAVIRDRPAPGLVERRAAILTDVLGLDAARVRGWTLVQCVLAAAWRYGAVEGFGDFLDAAALVRALRP